MSKPSTPQIAIASSSLGNLSKPASPSLSPTNDPSKTHAGMKNYDDQIALLTLQHTTQAAQHAKDMMNMNTSLQKMMTMMQAISTQTSITAPAQATAAAAASPTVVVPVSIDSSVVNASLSHGRRVKQQLFDQSQTLFGISENKQNAIADYSNSTVTPINPNSTLNLNPNSTFDMMNDSTIDMNNATNLNLNSSVSLNTNPHNISFLSQLMPIPEPTNPTYTFNDIYTSGLKAVASTHAHKIKDVDSLLQLLQEQAKLIVLHSRTSSVAESQAPEFLLYTLRLFKILLMFGLQATLEYHFALIKLIQDGETKLNADQPMLMLDMVSKYKRLVHTNLLTSQLVHSPSTAKPYGTKSTTAARNATSKFSGTPCSYHTKLLGKPANHADADCRAKGKQ